MDVRHTRSPLSVGYGDAVQAGEKISPIRSFQPYLTVPGPRFLENPPEKEAEAVDDLRLL